MDLEEEINAVLFEMGKSIKIYRVDAENTVLDIEYQKYTIELLRLFRKYLTED